MKKIFTIVMVICLMATLLCVSTFAADNEPAANIVLRVSALKTDGSPNDPPVVIKDYDNFQDGWNYAMELAGDEDVMKEKKYGRIIVDLYADWKANADGEFTEEIWNGDGFDNDTICIPGDAKVTLNMNGHTIDRGLTWGEDDGEVIYISSDADVVINNGTIRGGRTYNGAGGIHIKSDANVTLNNVNIVGNLASSDGGGIYVGSDSSLVMNGGSFIDNNIYNMSPTDYGYGGAVCVDNATAVFKGVEFRSNHAGFPFAFAAAISADDSYVTIEDCVFDENGLENQAEEIRLATSIIQAVDSTIKVKGSSFTNNGEYFKNAHVDYSSTFIVDDSELTIEECEFSNNGSDFIIADKDDSYVSISNTKFVDNKSAVMRGDSDTSTDSFFDNCTFNNNVNHSGYESFYNITTNLTFYNCSMGDSTFSDKTHIKFFSDVSESYVNLSVSTLKKDGTTVKIADYVSFETGWNAAIDLAKKKTWLQANDVDRVVIDLHADWTAVNDDFGSGSGFDWSTIFIPGGTKITLNMNGHTINRDLKTWDFDGEVIHVDEDSDVIINNGTIKGGWSNNGAGGIYVDNDARLELNNVHVVGNIADVDNGGGIGVYPGATLVMNGGSIKNNKADAGIGNNIRDAEGGAIYAEGADVTLKNVEIKNNQIGYRKCQGAAISAKNSTIEIDQCIFEENGVANESEGYVAALSVFYFRDSTVTIKNSTFTGNGTMSWSYTTGSTGQTSKGKQTSLFSLTNATLVIEDNCKFANNEAAALIRQPYFSDCSMRVSDSTFTDNEAVIVDSSCDDFEDSYFRNCTFKNNDCSDTSLYDDGIGHDFYASTITFYDCDLEDSTFGFENPKIVNTDAPDGAPVASIFGEGSMAMIISLIAVCISIASIGVTIYYNKKKANN